jgi:hypothetical protein
MFLLSLLRPKRDVPQARLDQIKLHAYRQLGISEMFAAMLLVVMMPLVTVGADLPLFERALLVVSFPLWALLLFFVTERGGWLTAQTTTHWMPLLASYWLRQRRFYRRHASHDRWRVDVGVERYEQALALAANHLSFAWREGADGRPELHIYEVPTLPYRGWIRAGGEPRPYATEERP